MPSLVSGYKFALADTTLTDVLNTIVTLLSMYVTNSVRIGGGRIEGEKGGEINNHTAVFRTNDAPTRKYDAIVGNRTTIRVMNSRTCGFSERSKASSLILKLLSLRNIPFAALLTERENICIHYSANEGRRPNEPTKDCARRMKESHCRITTQLERPVRQTDEQKLEVHMP